MANADLAVGSDDAPPRPDDQYPGGACWCMWYYWSFERFERSASNLSTRRKCLAWLQKLNELDADDKYRAVVADRLEELQ